MDQLVQEKLNQSKLLVRLLEDKCLFSIVMKELTLNQWDEYSSGLSNVELGDVLMSLTDC